MRVLRRLENIVPAYRLRKPSALPSPYFLRARRRKQLSTVSYSLTRRFDQKILQKRIYFLQYFFIQVADLVYHQPFVAGYHLASGEYIITEGVFLCDLMIYKTSF